MGVVRKYIERKKSEIADERAFNAKLRAIAKEEERKEKIKAVKRAVRAKYRKRKRRPTTINTAPLEKLLWG